MFDHMLLYQRSPPPYTHSHYGLLEAKLSVALVLWLIEWIHVITLSLPRWNPFVAMDTRSSVLRNGTGILKSRKLVGLLPAVLAIFIEYYNLFLSRSSLIFVCCQFKFVSHFNGLKVLNINKIVFFQENRTKLLVTRFCCLFQSCQCRSISVWPMPRGWLLMWCPGAGTPPALNQSE